MEGLLIFLAIVVVLAFLDAAAIRIGVDSTETSSDPRSPARGIGI
jgi:hypothetical protein